jgi:hypothetical protein
MTTIMVAIIGGLLGGSAVAALINQIFETVRERRRRKEKLEDSESEDIKIIKAGLKSLMLDRIRYVGQQYIKIGAIDFDDRKILNDMHTSYHNLGGNGDLDLLMQEVNALPLKQKGT